MTLVELIVVIAILPLVIGAISVALISVISQNNLASSKTTDSGDATVVSANFGPDVLSSSQVTTYSGSPALTPPVCGSGSMVVSLQWGASPTVVTYAVVSRVQYQKPTWVLYRYECFGNSATPSSSVVVAHNVQNPSGPTPLTATISGSSTSCGTTPGCTAQSFAKTAWASTQGVSSISMTVNSPEYGQTYTYTLAGTPRATSNTSRSSTPPGNPDPLIVVKNTGQVQCNNAKLVVDGSAEIDSAASPATIATGSVGKITATGGIYTDAGGTVSGNVYANGNTTTPITAPTGIVTNNADPYGNLTPPSTTGLSTFSSSNPTQGPGIYTNGISFSGTIQLQSGVYVVQGGVSGSGNLHITNATGGVLFYIESGGWSVSGGAMTSQNLSAWTSPFSPAPNLLIWEASTDNSTISLGGGTSDSYTGIVYAPSGVVQSNGGTSTTVSDLIAANVTCGTGASGTWTVTG